MKKLKDNKILMMVFRLLLILTAVIAVINMFKLFGTALSENDLDLDEEYEQFTKIVKMYNFTTISCVILLILSVISTGFCSRVSTAFRTVSLLFCTIMNFVGFHSNRVMGWACKIYNELEDGDYEALGLTKSEYREAVNFDGNDSIQYIFAILLVAVVLAILALTSIHWLAKKKEAKQLETGQPNA